MSLLETIITISAVLALGILYTILWFQLEKDVQNMIDAEEEYCPTAIDDESEE